MISNTPGNAFILVFSISSRQSLEELKPVLELINEVGWLLRRISIVFDIPIRLKEAWKDFPSFLSVTNVMKNPESDKSQPKQEKRWR